MAHTPQQHGCGCAAAKMLKLFPRFLEVILFEYHFLSFCLNLIFKSYERGKKEKQNECELAHSGKLLCTLARCPHADYHKVLHFTEQVEETKRKQNTHTHQMKMNTQDYNVKMRDTHTL